MKEKALHETYEYDELAALRQKIAAAEAQRDTQLAAMRAELSEMQARHDATTASLRADVAAAQAALDAALTHTTRAEKRNAFFLEAFQRCCTTAKSEEELKACVSQAMAAYQP